jgi:hypothetical protein
MCREEATMACKHDPKTNQDCCNYKHPSKVGKALVLACMDLRVVDDVVEYLNKGRVDAAKARGEKAEALKDEYDFVTMAGAALGATSMLRPHWGAMFWEHLELAIGLHSIDQVIIVEHQDCGAYKAFYHPADKRTATGAEEEECHFKTADALRTEILKRYPGVIKDVQLLYAALESKDHPTKAIPRSFHKDPARS